MVQSNLVEGMFMQKRSSRFIPSPLKTLHLRFEHLEPRWALSAGGLLDMPILPDAGAPEQVALAITAAPDQAGESFRTAYNFGELTGSRQVNDFVGGTDTRDVFRFELGDETDVTLTLSGLSQDVDLFLYNGRGRLIDRSTNSGRLAESIGRTLAEGTYYVAVDPYWRFSSNYRLSLEVPEPEESPADGGAFADVPYFGGQNQWNLNQINAPEAWTQGFTGEGILAAVVDTGVDLTHPELVSNLWVNEGEIPGNGRDDDGNGFIDDVRGWDFAGGDDNPSDQNGHGTHVAGTIAAANNGVGVTGVAPGATIMPVRVLDANGAGSTSSVAAGIRYAVDNGADLINLSLGGGFSSTILSALEYAAEHAVMVIAAAGNRGASSPDYPAAHSADLSNVLSVEAHAADGAKATFSNAAGSAVQVAAPGVAIYSTLVGGDFGLMSGTSMAAPHVTGLASLALSANSSLTPADLRAILAAGADRLIAGSDASGGVNAAATVARAAGFVQGQTQLSTTSSSVPAASTAWRPFWAHAISQSEHSAVIVPGWESAVGVGCGDAPATDRQFGQNVKAVDAALAQLDLPGGITPRRRALRADAGLLPSSTTLTDVNWVSVISTKRTDAVPVAESLTPGDPHVDKSVPLGISSGNGIARAATNLGRLAAGLRQHSAESWSRADRG